MMFADFRDIIRYMYFKLGEANFPIKNKERTNKHHNVVTVQCGNIVSVVEFKYVVNFDFFQKMADFFSLSKQMLNDFFT
jgi:hypothetical protein